MSTVGRLADWETGRPTNLSAVIWSDNIHVYKLNNLGSSLSNSITIQNQLHDVLMLIINPMPDIKN